MTLFGVSTQSGNPSRASCCRLWAPCCHRRKEVERVQERDFSSVPENTVASLEMLERHAYVKLTELIDGNHLDEAGKVAEVLKAVGLV